MKRGRDGGQKKISQLNALALASGRQQSHPLVITKQVVRRRLLQSMEIQAIQTLRSQVSETGLGSPHLLRTARTASLRYA